MVEELEQVAGPRDRFTAEGVPLLQRRSPIDRSESGLVSRDYQPIVGGPRLVGSWPLGAQSGDRFPAADWQIDRDDFVPVQRNILTAPQLAPVDFSPAYLVVCGRGHVDAGATLTIRLSNRYYSGKPYETSLELTATESTPFLSTAVEFAPDEPDYEAAAGRIFPEYSLEAKAADGTGYLHPGTGVQLWSE